MASGSTDGLDFGKTYVVNPKKGRHSVTMVWLHDIGQTGQDSEKAVKTLNLPNVQWICPTAPIRPVTSMGGSRTTAWFDVYSPISEDMRDDLGSLNYVTTYVALLLSYETARVIKGVGGFGMGAAQALFYASSYASGRVPIPANIVIGVNGWLPDLRNLQFDMSQHSSSIPCAESTQILITHGISGDINVTTYAMYPFVSNCADSLSSCGFGVSFIPSGGVHAMKEIRNWLLQNAST